MEKSLMVAGFGGQGVMLFGKLLAQAASENTPVTFFPSYGMAQRGGTANCYVVISDEEVGNPVASQLNDLVIMNQMSLDKFLPNLLPGGTLFVNSTICTGEISRTDIDVIKLPVTDLAIELGDVKVANLIMLGAYIGYTNLFPPETMLETLAHKLGKKPEMAALNEKAFNKGLELGKGFKK